MATPAPTAAAAVPAAGHDPLGLFFGVGGGTEKVAQMPAPQSPAALNQDDGRLEDQRQQQQQLQQQQQQHRLQPQHVWGPLMHPVRPQAPSSYLPSFLQQPQQQQLQQQQFQQQQQQQPQRFQSLTSAGSQQNVLRWAAGSRQPLFGSDAAPAAIMVSGFRTASLNCEYKLSIQALVNGRPTFWNATATLFMYLQERPRRRWAICPRFDGEDLLVKAQQGSSRGIAVEESVGHWNEFVEDKWVKVPVKFTVGQAAPKRGEGGHAPTLASVVPPVPSPAKPTPSSTLQESGGTHNAISRAEEQNSCLICAKADDSSAAPSIPRAVDEIQSAKVEHIVKPGDYNMLSVRAGFVEEHTTTPATTAHADDHADLPEVSQCYSQTSPSAARETGLLQDAPTEDGFSRPSAAPSRIPTPSGADRSEKASDEMSGVEEIILFQDSKKVQLALRFGDLQSSDAAIAAGLRLLLGRAATSVIPCDAGKLRELESRSGACRFAREVHGDPSVLLQEASAQSSSSQSARRSYADGAGLASSLASAAERRTTVVLTPARKNDARVRDRDDISESAGSSRSRNGSKEKSKANRKGTDRRKVARAKSGERRSANRGRKREKSRERTRKRSRSDAKKPKDSKKINRR